MTGDLSTLHAMVRYFKVAVVLTLLAAAIGRAPPGGEAAAANRWAANRPAVKRDVDVPAGIDATGGRDVTAELNTFLAGVGPGTTVRFPSHGRYRVENVVVMDRRHDVTIEGNGSTLIATTDGSGVAVPFYNFRAHWPRMREHFDIRDSTGITVRDLIVQGPNPRGEYRPELEAQAGFVILRSKVVTLDGVTARATYGDGVYIQGLTEDVTIRNCTLDHNGRQGVAVVSGERIVVENCTIRATGRSAIDLEPAHGFVRTVHVRNNRVSDFTNFLLAAVGAGTGVQDIWLEHNRVEGGRGVSVFVGTERSVRLGIHVVDNSGDGVSDGYQGALMRFTRFDGIEVKGNRQRVADGVTPVLLVNSCNSAVAENDFQASVATVHEDGGCSTPIPLPRARPRVPGRLPARPQPRSTDRVPRTSSTPTPTVVTVASNHGKGTSPVAIAIALAIGALTGIGGTLLMVRRRREAPDEG